MSALSGGDRYIVEMIVGRCHVGDSFLTVARSLKSRMRKGAWASLTRARKRAFLRAAIDAHIDNRNLYSDVMSGRIG